MAEEGSGAGATAPRPITRADLVGTWRLRTWEATPAGGARIQPFGPRPMGYVVYTADGRMLTTISRSGRAAIGGDLLAADDRARAEAFGSFVAYAGTFRLDGGEVIHGVEMSLYPDWVGSEQRRGVALNGDRSELTLSAELPSREGDTLRHELRWVRLG